MDNGNTKVKRDTPPRNPFTPGGPFEDSVKRDNHDDVSTRTTSFTKETMVAKRDPQPGTNTAESRCVCVTSPCPCDKVFHKGGIDEARKRDTESMSEDLQERGLFKKIKIKITIEIGG